MKTRCQGRVDVAQMECYSPEELVHKNAKFNEYCAKFMPPTAAVAYMLEMPINAKWVFPKERLEGVNLPEYHIDVLTTFHFNWDAKVGLATAYLNPTTVGVPSRRAALNPRIAALLCCSPRLLPSSLNYHPHCCTELLRFK